MGDITATIRVESPNLPLTETVAYDPAATVKPVSGAGATPELGTYLFTVETEEFARFEQGLERDPTIDSYKRVIELGTEAMYRFEYSDDAIVFSEAIAAADGISRDWVNEGTVWTVRVWLPERTALTSLWKYANQHDIEFSLERVTDSIAAGEPDYGLTAAQRDAVLQAFEMGYFEEPRGASMGEVATALGISQPAAGGRLRRGLEQLVLTTLAADVDD